MAAAKKGKKKGKGGGRPSTRRPAASPTAKPASAKKAGTAKSSTAKSSTPKSSTAKSPGATEGARSTRAARLEAARRARRRKALAIRGLLIFLVIAVVGLFVLNNMSNRREANALEERLTAGGCTVDSRADRTDPAPNNHVPNPTYQVNPPAGGNHLPGAASADTYEEDNVPPDGQLVHSLEHGYVIIWHRPDLSEEDKQAIRRAAGQYERDVLIVPRASMEARVAATAWGRRLLCPAPETGPLEEFIKAYRNQGPEKVEH